MMSPTNISRFFLTVAGLCTALGGMQAFQAFGDSTPKGHKITSIIMGLGIVAAYLASSPLLKPNAVAAEAKKPEPPKVAGIGIILAFLALTGLSCAHIQPIAACATDLVVQSIKDAFADAQWENEVEQLAVQYGAGVIECVVEQLLASRGADAASSKVVKHAKMWKAVH